MTERLHKLLAQAGLGSRREVERWIAQGLVTVNGKVAQLGDQAGPEDQIAVRGRPVSVEAPAQRVVVYHKPEGEVTTRSDPEGRPTVFEHLPRLRQGRWVSIGRLDLNTSGLLLFTTDGKLANRLMHPSTEVEREYAVRVLGAVEPAVIQRLLAGVELEDGPARFDDIREAGGTGANHWYHVTLKEGRNREVRRLWESQGITVSRLIRVRYGCIQLGTGLRLGRWRELESQEMKALYQQAGLSWKAPRKSRIIRPPKTRRAPGR
ncbi:ribosomal large subunit pseudouridine synthase B [Ectothiorhodospira sp. PHS-1]|uniref:23S rRNA pseudouridine(2605) synthase RluB n=1 Tax=Ectothiorhodospira sp. PHS-1 TaxID=519989 RepID=UPI00024A825A|nr:pseudouridine synthase [Ectothiorhodospira sp. PHS-1]EHQ52094.1 ribosomal large subunit pseudouridine synthase B [Ectothiorhodospira sp. PHS-1]